MKALDLRPDGTFVVRDGDREWAARRPKIGEWRHLVEAVEAADAAVREAQYNPEGTRSERERLEAVQVLLRGTNKKPPLYTAVLAKILETLGAGPVLPDDLPAWCSSSDPIGSILGHWRAVPLDLSPEPTISVATESL
jgi:hypothetical protein